LKTLQENIASTTTSSKQTTVEYFAQADVTSVLFCAEISDGI
jgi:hypothetical protein